MAAGTDAADKIQAELAMFARLQFGPVIEMLLHSGVVVWLCFLINDVNDGVQAYLRVCGADSLRWAQGCSERELPWRSIIELALVGGLLWWPLNRSLEKQGRRLGESWPDRRI